MDDKRDTHPDEYIAYSTSSSDHHYYTRQKYQRSIALLIMVCLICVIGIAVLVILVIKGNETLEQSNQTCLKCQTLSTIVDKWAWKNVSEDTHTDKCCFNSDTGLATTLKYIAALVVSTFNVSSSPETERLQENVDTLYTLVWNHLLNNRTNATSIPPYTHPDLLTLMQLINNVFHRKRSVLHLTSLKTIIAEDSDPKISWAINIKQGHLSLSNDTCSVSIMNTGLYFISTQVKFRTNVFNIKTLKITAQFYLATFRERQLSYVDDYKIRYVFRERNNEHEAKLHSMTRLETGDTLIIRFPSSKKSYIATERGAHRISIFELP